ncbi:phage GP46 family protein [Rhizobium sp. BK602]|uniref:phage GP46 family protein n=1 Tax=Rhizobium sp. BK602 TaxID=2586986 RepID=UPI001620249A|nr:phage GP46 family protein [Rhizobium sp. BK602]MBB3608678.1 phage gp46-like protein [Rhizobium sp. BK602]
MLKIIPIEGDEDPYRAPDLGWDGEVGYFVINPLTHADAPGDFRAEQGLATQVLIYLMTDRRVDPSELRDGDENRGWVGDSFDMAAGEQPLGSRLWLLRRSAIYDGIEVKVEAYVREALQPLLDVGAVVRIDVTVEVDRPGNRVSYEVSLYGRDGRRVYDNQFELLWRQIDGVDHPLAG